LEKPEGQALWRLPLWLGRLLCLCLSLAESNRRLSSPASFYPPYYPHFPRATLDGTKMAGKGERPDGGNGLIAGQLLIESNRRAKAAVDGAESRGCFLPCHWLLRLLLFWHLLVYSPARPSIFSRTRSKRSWSRSGTTKTAYCVRGSLSAARESLRLDRPFADPALALGRNAELRFVAGAACRLASRDALLRRLRPRSRLHGRSPF